MREEINESVSRMDNTDRHDVAVTFGLATWSKSDIRTAAYADEDIAEYVLNY